MTPHDYYNYLAHYGVLGMKWGVRKDNTRSTSKLRRMAKKDAKRYVEAKAYYGEGAGIQRRKLNNRIKQRSKNPSYKAEFDAAVKRQDTEKAAIKADRKRRAVDTMNTGKRYTKKALKIIGPVLAASATAYAFKHQEQISNFIEKHANEVARRVSAEALKRKVGAS